MGLVFRRESLQDKFFAQLAGTGKAKKCSTR